MEKPLSFRFVKLGLSMFFLLASSICFNAISYVLIVLGGIALMMSFASFGQYDYRGVPCKRPYTIGRYLLSVLLIFSAVAQIYAIINQQNIRYIHPYYLVVYIAFASYLIMYRPSDTTISQKCMKVIGYMLMMASVTGLENVKVIDDYLTYITIGISWMALLASFVVMLIGILLLVLSGKSKAKIANVEAQENTEITDVNL
jgi:hypothetical protein